MKRLLPLLLLTATLVQADPGLIRLLNATIDPSAPEASLSSLAPAPVAKDGCKLYLVQPESNFTAEDRQVLKEMGVTLEGYIPPNACTLLATPAQMAEVQARFKCLYVGDYLPEYKVVCREVASGQRLASAGTAEDPSTRYYVLVAVLKSDYLPRLQEKLEEMGVREEGPADSCTYPALKVRLTASQIREVAALAEVCFVEDYEDPKPCCDAVRRATSANVEAAHALGYRGAGQIICIQDTGFDNGDPANIHPDFKGKRIQGRATASVARLRGTYDDYSDAGDHGTHVAGCALGSGAMSDGQYRGMACDADIFALCAGLTGGSIGSGTFEDHTNVYHCGARIINNSWGSGIYGSYGSSAIFYDDLCWKYKDLTVCHAAGNSNGSNYEDPDCKLMSQAAAKNSIVVGASESEKDSSKNGLYRGLAGFSARGLTADGRMKPDIVQVGCNVTATLASQEKTSVRSKYYHSASGTSMSSPLLAGCAAVVREYLEKDRHVSSPSSALVKAVLIAGAYSMYPGQYYPTFLEVPKERPNKCEGHGHVDLKESILPEGGRLVFFEDTLKRSGQAVTNTFTLPAGTGLSVALAWTDYPGTVGASRILVNDLDLYVIDPAGVVHTRNNHLDNTEILHFDAAPAPGRYTVIVKADTIMEGPQPAAVAVNFGVKKLAAKLELAREPLFEVGKNTCEIILTNTCPGSSIEFSTAIEEDLEKIFSISPASGTFKSSQKVILTANVNAATGDFPVCQVRLFGGPAGYLQRRIGVWTGNAEKGYTLYAGNFDGDHQTHLTDLSSFATATPEMEEGLVTLEPETVETVFSQDFEDFEQDVSLIKQFGFTLAEGKDTNGTTMVRREYVKGHFNKYLEIKRLGGSAYTPQYKITGPSNGWSKDYTSAFIRITGRVKMNDRGDKGFGLWGPAIAEPVFNRQGGRRYCVDSGSGSSSYPRLYSTARVEPDKWTDFELLIDVGNYGGRHLLRRVKLGDTVQDCMALLTQSGAQDYFTALRFKQHDYSTFCLDDLKIETCQSPRTLKRVLRCQGSNASSGLQEDERGLFLNVGVPAGMADSYDLVVDARLAVSGNGQKVVLGQDAQHRQFQSELKVQDGKVAATLTDYPSAPGLCTATAAPGEFFRYGFRLKASETEKVLRKVFFGEDVITAGGAVSGSKVRATDEVRQVRIYLPPCDGGRLDIASLKVRLMPQEKARLHVVARSFAPEEQSLVWTITNEVPVETVNYTARITEGAELFSVSPASGSFTDLAQLTITALSGCDEKGLERGALEIDAGPAGSRTIRFQRPTGNPWDGYVLYSDDFASGQAGEIRNWHASWSYDDSDSAIIGNDYREYYLRLKKAKASSKPLTEQGIYCYVGVPQGLGSNLYLHFSGQLRVPETFKGAFYLTQDEPHRQFQTSFALYTSGGQKQVKATLTDYARNTALLSNKAPTDQFVDFDYSLNMLYNRKVLKDITFDGNTKNENQRISGSKVAATDALDYYCFRVSQDGSYVDLRNLAITLVNPVPEPALAGLLLLGLLLRRRS